MWVERERRGEGARGGQMKRERGSREGARAHVPHHVGCVRKGELASGIEVRQSVGEGEDFRRGGGGEEASVRRDGAHDIIAGSNEPLH